MPLTIQTSTVGRFLALLPGDILSISLALIIRGQKNYAFIGSVVCVIAPILTTLRVEYGATINATVVESLRDPLAVQAAGLFSFTAVTHRFSYGQDLIGNAVGDSLSAIHYTRPLNSTGGREDVLPVLVSFLLEAPWRVTR